MKNLFVLLLLGYLINISYGQSPCPNYPTLNDKFTEQKSGYHSYSISNVAICPVHNAKNFDKKAIFEIMASNISFQAPTDLLIPVPECKKVVLMSGDAYMNVVYRFLANANDYIPFFNTNKECPIATSIDKKNFSIVNYTLPTHPLHDGKVTRMIVAEGGYFKVLTVGVGNNISKVSALLNGNKLAMTYLWDNVDERLKAEVQKRLSEPEINQAVTPTILTSFKINPQHVTHPTDKGFKWYDWKQAPEDLKTASKYLKTEDGKALYDLIKGHLDTNCGIKITANDLNDDGIAGLAFMASNCDNYCGIAGCTFRLYDNGGTLKADLSSTDGVKPGKNCVIALATNFIFRLSNIGNNSNTDEIEKLFRYREEKPKPQPLPDNELVGGVTPDELGQNIFKALQTNNRKLFVACIHPHPLDDDRASIEEAFDRIKDDFQEVGLTQWNLTKYSRVTFSKEGFTTNDGGKRNGEQVRRNLTIEFTYKGQEFIGRIEGGTIVTYNKKFFLWYGGFEAILGRL